MRRVGISLTFALSAALGATATVAATVDEFEQERGVVFSAEDIAEQAAKQKRPQNIEGGWTPAEGDVRALEPLVARRLKAEIERHARPGDAPLHPSGYYRQYVGLTRNGRRLVLVNGFHEEHLESYSDRPADFWKHELTGAFDGGCIYFHAIFDPTTQMIELACQPDPSPDNERQFGPQPGQ